MISLVWASAGFLAWFFGSTALQAQARRRPIDPLLNLAVLSLTIVAFHASASLTVALAPQATPAPVYLAGDIILALLATWGIRRRVHLESPYLVPTILILAGSFSFWMWYIGWTGGLLPK